MVAVTSWGRLGCWEHDVRVLNEKHQVLAQLKSDSQGIAYGMGRSYGDVCLNPKGLLWKTSGLDRFISFDETTGLLKCESGVLLRDIQRLFIPRGWILPVTPGTQMVTVGGAIANDVHGKNHHIAGSFGNHIQKIKLARTDGSIIECGPNMLPEWFAATVGGIGLTGVILEAVIQLTPVVGPWLITETLPYEGLDEFFQFATESEPNWPYTVSWIDCLAKGRVRGLFMRARPCEQDKNRAYHERRWAMPLVPPVSLVNSLSLRAFNWMYFNAKKNQKDAQYVHYEPFFYPLDHVNHWNKMYGPKGFFQYQTVTPPESSIDAIQAMLDEISQSKQGSFLTVLKTFGSIKSLGMLSFPMQGVTLALDFPNKGLHTHKLFDRLDAIVRTARGRNYLAKDARMPKDLFENGYPHFHELLPYRDPGISSAMSRRLIGD
ncbi:FAD-binding oxidoreductase [Legionella cincinnatiensis]|uniref:Delta(24)-sterol reductase n=1 Tax=Legionella cincinnatiensis TaxID=28085 RepID=A0A378IWX4_9GAMM|nr:FAD-binding oxidoreductase [Legionella cincinnatiensis]KTC93484.1 oxidoreductase [Legionella cincinnatiensis]STX36514.1 oxidoreductase [Legionella cincinnatiensis]